MNIAVLIAVSEYQNYSNLYACEKDADAIEHMLSTGKKFDHVLRISKNTKAQQIKAELTEFVKSHQTSSVDELLFYYSGHGEYFDDEFYFIPTDFDKNKRKQTSLENTELDQLIRSLSPSLTVKIVDACQSGVRYVKDTDTFKKHLISTREEYKKCYFMFSSNSDQSSFQDSELSFFTRSIVNAVSDHQEGDIRYKDIVDSISDQFQNQESQTPFFVIQADYTEIFISIGSELRSKLTSFLPVIAEAQLPEKPERSKASLFELVSEESKGYFSEEDASTSLERIAQTARNYKISDNLEQLYDLIIKTEGSLTYLGECGAIGRWLEKNRNIYFAEPVKEIVTTRKRVPKFSSIMYSISHNLNSEFKYEDVEEEKIVGLESTVQMPFEYITVCAEPRLPNLKYYECHLVPVVSRTEIRLFRRFCSFKDENWKTRSIDTYEKWAMFTCRHMQFDENDSRIKTELESFEEYILTPLKQQYFDDAEVGAEPESQ